MTAGIRDVGSMRSPVIAILTVVVVVAGGAGAGASASPTRQAWYTATSKGHFGIVLGTSASGRRMVAGAPGTGGHTHPVPGIIVLCPTPAGGSGPIELQIGFPGAALKPIRHRYRFSRSYTAAKATLINFGTHISTPVTGVAVKVAGVVTWSRRITGTVSVTTPGCPLTSSTYNAKLWRPQPA